YPEYNPAFPAEPTETIPDSVTGIWREFYTYYGMKRGHHPHARAGATTTSIMSWANFPLLDDIATLTPRPILFIVGENATSRFFSDDAYAAASQPKELMVIAGANHVDLYDDLTKIPFDKLESFFNEAFNN
ncbi:MAG: alpha/beta hydrolase, partial [Brevinema sp.]